MAMQLRSDVIEADADAARFAVPADGTAFDADLVTKRALISVAECAMAAVGGSRAEIRLDGGEVLVEVAAQGGRMSGACRTVANGLRDAEPRSGAPTGIGQSKRSAFPSGEDTQVNARLPVGILGETLAGADGRRLGTLTVKGCPPKRPAGGAEATIMPHLARIAAAILEQRAGLEAAMRRFRDTFSQSPNPNWIYDYASLRFLDVNEAAIRFYGYSREQFLGMTVLEIQPPEERRRMVEAMAGNSDLDTAATWRHCRADGRPVDVITHGRRINFDGVDAVIVVATDRTDLLALRQDLSETQLMLDTIIAAMPAGLFVKDMQDNGRYWVYNPAVAGIAGLTSHDAVGHTDIEIFGPAEGARYMAQDLDVMAGGRQQTFDGEDFICRSGEIRQLLTIKKPLPTSDGSPPRFLLGISEDITERRRSAEQISHLAHYDFLTDLPNRVLFQQHLDRAVKRRRKSDAFALFYLDLDFLKTINDTYGHHIGDRLLKHVAGRLKDCLRGLDLVARMGGDEFAIVAQLSEGEAEAMTLADRILKSFDAPFDLEDCVVHVDTSIGIALSRRQGQDNGEALMRHADIALYAAKAEGRGVAKVYADRMSLHVEARQMMSEDLRRALSRNEFELDYQPLHDLASGQITGFEALVRWRHPSRGLISPADFIPVAEQTGLIVPIGEWVLREACSNAARWPETIKIAVNLSAVQFRKGGLVELIERTLAETRLAPSRLELEITESVLLTDSGPHLQILHRLRALGVRIAMDDFGTGYSSLSYLRSFPFDKIKLDRSFVPDVGENDENLAIVRAVTGLGASLGIRTTAEGIETPEQFARLKAEGFDELQGYLIGRPMPADRAMALAFAQGATRSEATAA